MPSPTGSFLKFVMGFVTFLVLSFGLTLAVNSYTTSQNRAQQAAAAEALMLQ